MENATCKTAIAAANSLSQTFARSSQDLEYKSQGFRDTSRALRWRIHRNVWKLIARHVPFYRLYFKKIRARENDYSQKNRMVAFSCDLFFPHNRIPQKMGGQINTETAAHFYMVDLCYIKAISNKIESSFLISIFCSINPRLLSISS